MALQRSDVSWISVVVGAREKHLNRGPFRTTARVHQVHTAWARETSRFLQTKHLWQRCPSLLPHLRMRHLHLLHTHTTKLRLRIPLKLIRRQHLQNPRSPNRGSRDSIESPLVCFHTPRVRGPPRTLGGTTCRRAAENVGRVLDREYDPMCLLEFHLPKCHQPAHRRPQRLTGKRRIRRKSSVHQRVQSSSSRHVICHRQGRCNFLLDEKVQHCIGMGFGCLEYVLPECPGRVQSFEILWVCIADVFEQPDPKVWHVVIGRNPKKRRKGGEIRNFVSILESVHVYVREYSIVQDGGITQGDK